MDGGGRRHPRRRGLPPPTASVWRPVRHERAAVSVVRYVRTQLARRPLLRRLFPWLAPAQTIFPGSVAEGSALAGTATVTGHGWVWPGDGSVEDRFQAIISRMDQTDHKLTTLDQRDRLQHAELVHALEDLRQDVTGKLQQVTVRLETSEQIEAQVNFHGVWVLGIGVVVAIPGKLASIGYGGEVILAVLVAIAAWQTTEAVRAHLRSAR